MRLRILFGLVILTLAAQNARAAFGFVTGSGANATNASTSPSVTIQSTGAGDLIVVHLAFTSSTITASSPVCGAQSLTASTSSPNTNASGPIRDYYYYILSATGGQTTCSATLSSSANWVMLSSEFTWGGSASTFDKDSVGSGNSATPAVTSYTPTNAGALVVGGTASFVSGGTWTAGSGYTIPANAITTSGVGGTKAALEYNLSVSSATTTPFTSSNSGQWTEISAAFNPPAGTKPPPTLMLTGVGD